MKKLYLSITLFFMFILMFAITMIPSQAYTFNGTYDFSNVDLDASLTELNGASLNNLFDYDYLETLPLIEWNGYRNKYELVNGDVTFNEYVYIDLGYKNLFDKTRLEDTQFRTSTLNVLNNGIEIIASTTQSYTSKTFYYNLINNETYSISYDSTTTGQSGGTLEIRDFYNNNLLGVGILGSNKTTFTTISNKIKLTFNVNSTVVETNTVVFDNIQLEYGNLETDFKPFGVLSEVYRLNTPAISNNDLVQSLYLYNLENINIDLLNYYFAIYLLNAYDLPIGDLWSYAWTAGNDSGYNNGFTEGQSQGLIEGYNTGYNEGVDYAVQENISILSLFELIFGVVINMLTFIITIDIFGISILSLISVLSLFVGVVWILKMIRG